MAIAGNIASYHIIGIVFLCLGEVESQSVSVGDNCTVAGSTIELTCTGVGFGTIEWINPNGLVVSSNQNLTDDASGDMMVICDNPFPLRPDVCILSFLAIAGQSEGSWNCSLFGVNLPINIDVKVQASVIEEDHEEIESDLSSVIIECSTSCSYPTPIIEWSRHDGTPIENTPKETLTSCPVAQQIQVRSALEITDASSARTYNCTVSQSDCLVNRTRAIRFLAVLGTVCFDEGWCIAVVVIGGVVIVIVIGGGSVYLYKRQRDNEHKDNEADTSPPNDPVAAKDPPPDYPEDEADKPGV